MGDVEQQRALELLKLKSLGNLAHGKVGVAFDRELQRMGRDCIDRPSDDRVRTVTLSVSIKPTAVVDGQITTCEGAKAVAKVKSKMPDYETQEIDLGIRENGSTVFAPACPEDHRQGELFPEPDELK
jgi:hypothetical protein